ncbi:MAG: hypothetical protein IIV98_01660 [Aeriscardovia sp.]|nr:hypothetical protein [Aeriscardovia sp.]MBQ5779933.1 hypothetical protein [Aeriscardovia sp.]
MAEEQPGEFKDVFSPIDKMYKILADARSGFMDQDLVKVSRSSLENLLDELKQALPTQLKSAVELMRNADAQMSQAMAEAQKTTRKAEAQAERIVAEAQKRADYISSNDNIVKIASQKADALMAEAKERSARIVAEAQKRAEELKASSQRWCLENLQILVETLKKLESTTQGGIENIKFKQKQNINQKNGGK